MWEKMRGVCVCVWVFVSVWLCAVRRHTYSKRRREMNPAPLSSLNSEQLLYRDKAISGTHTPSHKHTHLTKRLYWQRGGGGGGGGGEANGRMKWICETYESKKHTCTHKHTRETPRWWSFTGIFDVATFIPPPIWNDYSLASSPILSVFSHLTPLKFGKSRRTSEQKSRDCHLLRLIIPVFRGRLGSITAKCRNGFFCWRWAPFEPGGFMYLIQSFSC